MKTTPSKFIDLAPRIINEDPRRGVSGTYAALKYLDDHPDQVPGRTITESEFSAGLVKARVRATDDGNPGVRHQLLCFGITVVPDPEPTNAEKLAALIRESEGHLQNPDGSVWTASRAAEFLDARGVTAPGGDDD